MIIESDGVILTNEHVVRDAKRIRVTRRMAVDLPANYSAETAKLMSR